MRRAYQHRVDGTQAKCPTCRYGRSAPKVTEADRRWWTDRYSLSEIVEIAEGFFGPREQWPP